jgi:3-dehydroquinate synthase class II
VSCAENLVAAFQGKAAAIFGVCSTAQDAQILLEALEIGADGVVLRSNDFAEVNPTE